MPTKIAHRELRNNSSDVLRRVESGETFLVTNHGKVVAVISPLDAGSAPIIIPARPNLRFADFPSVKRDEDTQSVLDELRGDK